MGAKLVTIIGVLCILSGCAISSTSAITKIALLAPFEGQYREIGYEALYATRLALNEFDLPNIDLLAIDDGGREETAILRAEAISQDPTIKGVLILGIHASSHETQMALGTVPTIIVGHWNTSPVQASIFMMSNPSIDNFVSFTDDIIQLDAQEQAINGSELLSLAQVPQIIEPAQIIIYTSAMLADDIFVERYLNSAEFVPEPRLIAPLSYDAMSIMLTSIMSDTSLEIIQYEGITGTIRFVNGYWEDAPLNQFGYEDGNLISLP